MPNLRRLAVAVLVASLPQHVAAAESGPGSLVSIRPTRIDVKAMPGFDNALLITEAAGTVSIIDGSGGAALLAATPDCSVASGVVTCATRPVLRVKLGDGNDSLVNLTSIRVVAKGGSGDDELFGGAGDDQLGGDSGNDLLYGREGADDLRGGTGDDVLDGGPGADRFNGQSGDDTASYADPSVWPVVTRDGQANDGVPGEGDNVLPSVEHVDVDPFNFRADDAVIARGGALPVAAETWPAAGDFDLETRREVGVQALAYYDEDGKIGVAARRIGETTWVRTQPLPTIYVKSWDQHRYLELAFDPDGRLHLIGNLHGLSIGQTELVEVCCSPLQYFRTPDPVDDPEDVLTLTRSAMVSAGPDVPLPFEDVATYPEFFSEGERFFFVYRDGWSNAAEWYVHQLDRFTGRWLNPNGNQPWYSGVRNAAPPPSGSLNPQTAGFYFDFGLHQGRFSIVGHDSWLFPANCGVESVDGRCAMSYVSTADFDHFHDAAGVELQTPILPTHAPQLPWSILRPMAASGGLRWASTARGTRCSSTGATPLPA